MVESKSENVQKCRLEQDKKTRAISEIVIDLQISSWKKHIKRTLYCCCYLVVTVFCLSFGGFG
jgi:hypothetical protein